MSGEKEGAKGFEGLREKEDDGASVACLFGFEEKAVEDGAPYRALIWLCRVVLPAPSRPRRRIEYSGCEVAWR